ncbi:MAG: hypothetical protein HUJ26_07345 [Planctomycetaceae bacterium]|nr:hypothetical protein [Planctomycetaceae bacterium]
MFILNKLRRLLFVLTTAMTAFSFTVVSWGQPNTLEIRDSDVPQNREFNEAAPRVARQPLNPAARQPINPQLLQVLKDWEQKTQDYKKLSGGHRRFVYDSVFQVEKRSDGDFYYEAPDKGRIDIKQVEIPAGAKSQKLNKQGKPYSLQSDIPEKWICDGKQIAQANDERKEYMIHNIPPQDQGINIMDGPLPFLFGLPAEKAVERYDFTLLPQTNERSVWLKVLPRRKQDAVNWKEAEVILDRKTYLPIAVKLVNPAGTTETVYSFRDLKINEHAIISNIFGRGNPFDIKRVLRGYKEIKQAQAKGAIPQNGVPKQAQPDPQPQPRPQPKNNVAGEPQGKPMPNTVNAEWKKVQAFFEKEGFEVEFQRAGPAPSKELVFRVARQEPAAGTPVKPGQKLIFFLYEEVRAASNP